MNSALRSAVIGVLTGLAVPAAQLAAQRPIQFGPMAGISIAGWHGSDVQETMSRTGLAAGAFLRVKFSSVLQLEPQLLYVQKGTRLDAGGGVTGTIKQDYVQFPLLLKVTAPAATHGGVAPNLFVGPAMGFRVTCKIRAEDATQSAEDTCANQGVEVKTTDFSIVLGAGVDIGRIVLQGRYDLGLTRIGDNSDPTDLKTKAFIFTLGFVF